MHTRQLVWTGIMAALLILCAWLTIPTVIPFTMQTFGIFLAVGLLGGRLGSLAVGIYLLMGAVGLPVFSGFRGGLGALVGITGGYLIGFLLLALVMWLGERLFGSGTAAFVCSGIAGLAICYAFGTIWYLLLYTSTAGPVSIWTVLGSCVIPFLIPDGIKLLLALSLRRRLQKAMKLDQGISHPAIPYK